MLRIRTITAIGLLCSQVLPVHAQSAVDEEALLMLYGDEEMISIATGNRQPISKAPAVASVITYEDIKAMGATDLDEVLETVPGLHVARSHIGYNPIYTVRGIYSEFNPEVLLLINGIPITNLFHGDRGQVWAGMPVEQIARIEVIRGPGSAIYGADAFAGVVNITTKTAADIDNAEVGGRIGSFDTRDAWGVFAGEIGGFDAAFMLEYHETRGHREIIDVDAQSFFDSLPSGTDASLAPGPVNLQRENLDARLDLVKGNWQIRAGLQHRENGGNGAGVAQALDPNNRFASDRWNADVTYRREIGDSWDVSAQLSFLDVSQEVERDLLLFPPGTTLPIDSDGNISTDLTDPLVQFPDGVIGNPEVFERHYRLDLSAFFLGHAKHNWRFGAGAYYGDLYKVRETKNYGPGVFIGPEVTADDVVDVSGTPNVFLPEDDRTNHYLTVQDVWNFANDWELTTGVRYDDYSDFGDTVNPRVALVWSAHHNLTTKLLYGRAFRAPSFAETRKQNNPVARGNPDLKPEEIETIEWAFDYRPTERLQLGLNLFQYWWDDIIVFVSEGGAGTTAANAGEQTGHGAEVEMKWQTSRDLRFSANYAFQEATDETTGDPAGNAPNHQVYARADWSFAPNWRLVPQVNWVGERKRQSDDPRAPLEAYTWVDLTLRTTSLGRNTEAALSVRNVFDVDAREPSLHGINGAAIEKDLPLAGRSIYGELRYRF